MNRIKLLYQLLRYFGLGWVVFRIFYMVKIRSGFLQRILPAYRWSERPLSYWLRDGIPTSPEAYVKWRSENSGNFFFDNVPLDFPFATTSNVILQADGILRGSWQYFTQNTYDIGMPPNWHLNPLTGQSISATRHWTQISDFDAGDIKFIWEPSRFSAVFTLVRAYAINQDPKYAEAFWMLINDWAIHNPPQLGPNWKCGQEATFRIMAWCFGLYAFKDHATPEQITQLIEMIAAHGERIEKNISYARSQNNNHGVSEGVGLWTIGILFPEFKRSSHWSKIGKRGIEEEIRKQVFADGSYSQYSFNYQRVMLHNAIWALRLGELNSHRLSDEIYARVASSSKFLLRVMDNISGCVPNHGGNDSALVLPLNSCDPKDFRPLIQTAHYLLNKELLFNDINEDIYWLFGSDALESPISDNTMEHLENLSAEIGGYYTLRTIDSWMMIRCGDYHARPHHADQLHIDFWWKGINICCDAGTYLYNGDPPWQNGLDATRVHNTVCVDNKDQMTKYSRFLWLDWSYGKVRHHDAMYWEGMHNGYMRLDSPVTHRRAIKCFDNFWIIVDKLTSESAHNFRLHWLAPFLPHQLTDNGVVLETTQGKFYIYFSGTPKCISADPTTIDGWRSTTYAHKEPALSLNTEQIYKNEVVFWTILSDNLLHIRELDDSQSIVVNNVHINFKQDQLITVEAS